ncbi:hypothetical protein RRG08_057723 [Elysia crispata]|uniref:Uncharacterized protein n=1 Tax=Elysia crispata TaxID=231223 RepID=A0AAE0XUS2_9GAST|nr:hypothetical protein RRG08_057723 [Elysia crispata]
MSLCLTCSLFLENHPNLQVGYDSYRKRVVAKGISFAKLGVEECEQCMAFKLHEHSQPKKILTVTPAKFSWSTNEITLVVVSTIRKTQRKIPMSGQRFTWRLTRFCDGCSDMWWCSKNCRNAVS